MSEAVVPLIPVLQYDPRVNLKPSRTYAVYKSGKQVTYQVIPSTSYSLSQINYQAQVPNDITIVSRNVLQTFFYEFTITGTTTQATMSDCIGLCLASRCFPNAKIQQTINATINNTSVSINLSNNISFLEKCNVTLDEKRRNFSLAPSMVDVFQNYNDWDDFGTINPIAGYQGLEDQGRGSFDYQIISSSPTSLTFRFKSTEPLFLSPFSSEETHSAGFFGVKNLTLSSVLRNITNALSVDSISGDITISSVVGTFYQAPQLSFTFITPQDVARLAVH